jgi:hypothetical protein
MISRNTSESDQARAASGAPGGDPEALRDTLRKLAAAAGYRPNALVEWCSADAPGTPADLPPLFYAALLPDDPQADMPLGLGDTPVAALTDLLWAVGGSELLADLLADTSAAESPNAAPTSTPEASGNEH